MKKSFINFSKSRRRDGALPSLFVLVMLLGTMSAWGQIWETKTEVKTSGSSYELPQGTYKVTKLEAWGGGGGGASTGNNEVGGGGGGGGYATISLDVVTHSGVTVPYSAAQQVNPEVAGQNSTVSFGGKSITAYGGYAATGSNGVNGRGYTGSDGVTGYTGGKGGDGTRRSNTHTQGGGGGGGAGSAGNGGKGGDGKIENCGPLNMGICVSEGYGGTAGSGNGGKGGDGGRNDLIGDGWAAKDGNGYGGGGGGARNNGSGGKGAGGAVRITYKTLKLNVTFDKNGSGVSNMPDATTIWYYNKYNTITGYNSVPTRSGYTFQGWYFDAACTQPFTPNETCTRENDFTLYAKWKQNVVNFNITAQKYSACQNTLVHVELSPDDLEYSVYKDQECTQLSYPDNPEMFMKTTTGTETAYVRLNAGGTVKSVQVELNTHCGSLTDATCTDGTILFKEDFGGNNLSDPTYSLTENANASSALPFASGRVAGYGEYSLEKTDDVHVKSNPAYSDDTNPTHLNMGWCVENASDHTHERDKSLGYMMFIDPSAERVWEPMYTSTIDNLCSGSNLTFSFWVSDLQSGRHDHFSTTAAPALFDVQLQNPNTGEVLVQTGIWQPDRIVWGNEQIWQQYAIDFVVPAGLSKVKFVLRNANYTDISYGNDYAVDDIQVKFCGGKITTTATDQSTCSDVHAQLCNTVTLTGTSVFNDPAYKWQYSANGTSDWDDVANSNSTCINTSTTGYYRMFVANSDFIAGVPENGACALKTETNIELTAYDVDATNDYFNHIKGSTAVIDLDVLANDDNECGEAPIVTSNPTKGTITWNGSVFKYTPNASATGNDEFKYKLKCGTCEKEATVFITELDMVIGCPTADGNCYSFQSLTVSGNVRTITVGFTEDPETGMKVNLPTMPTGWVADGNDYTQFISLPESATAAEVQAFLRGVTFCVPANSLKGIRIVVDGEQTDGRIYYNSQNKHYYEYVKFDLVDEWEKASETDKPAAKQNMFDNSQDKDLTWIDCYLRAKATTYLGRQGYLPTITDSIEDIFITRMTEGVAWVGATRMKNTGNAGDLYYANFTTADETAPAATDIWYWACGPEKGKLLFDTIKAVIPSGVSAWNYYSSQVDASGKVIYSNWASGEPNNSGNESCLTILNTGVTYEGFHHHTAGFSWNDKGYKYNITNSTYFNETWSPRGYFVEFGDQPIGDSHEANEDDYRTNAVVRYEKVGNGVDTVKSIISGSKTFCSDESHSTELKVDFKGEAPFSGKITGSDNSEYTFTNINALSYTQTVDPTATTTYTVTTLSDDAATTCHPTVISKMEGSAVVTISEPLSTLTSITANKETSCFGEDVTFTANDAEGTVTDDLFWSETGCPQAAFVQNFHSMSYSYGNYRNDPSDPTTVSVNESGNIITHNGGTCPGEHCNTGGHDPYIKMYGIGSFDPSVYKYFQIRYKVTNGVAGNAEIFFVNGAREEATGGYSVSGALNSDGNWHVLTINAGAHSAWMDSNVSGWRFDFCTEGNSDMEIDYIALTNASYVGPTYTMSSATAGNHTVYVNRIGDCNEGSSTCVSKTVTVNQDFTPGAIKTEGQTVCYGGPKNPIGNDVYASGGDGNIHYKWALNDDIIVDAPDAPTYTPTVTAPDAYVYTRYAYDETCNTTPEKSTGSWTLKILPVVEATITGNDKICDGVTTDLCAPEGASLYEWSTGVSGATNRCITVSTTGNYTVTVTATSGCKTIGTKTVTKYDEMTAGSILYNLTVCSYTNDTLVEIYGATAASGGAPGGYYEWQMSSDPNFSTYTTIESNTEGYSVPIANSYHKYYRRAYVNDCGTVYTDSVYIINSGTIDAGTIQGSDAEYCEETNVSHTVNVGTITVASGAPYTVQWQTSPSNTEGSWVNAGDPIEYNNIPTDLSYTYTNNSFDGDVYIRYFVTVAGCEPFTGNGVVYLKMNPLPVIAIEDVTTDNVICPSVGTKEIIGEVTTASTADYTYTWSGDLTVTPATPTTTSELQNTVTATIPTTCDATYTVTLNVKDGKNCSAHAVSKTVEVKNTVASTITCASNIQQNTEEHKSYRTVTLDDPTYTGNCSPTYEITYSPAMSAETGVSATNASGKYPIGTTTVTYTVTDDCDKTATCSFTVEVIDNEPPCIGCLPPIDPEDPPHDPFDPTLGVSCASISVSGDPTKETDSGKRYFTQNDVEWNVTAWDNSGIAPTMSWYIVNPTVPTEPTLPDTVFSGATNGNTLEGQKFYVGTSKVVWTAEDGSGKKSSCEFFVVVNDVEPPILTCPSITTDIKCADEVPAPYNNYAAFTYYGGVVTDNDAFVEESFMMFSETKDSPDCTKKITRRYIIQDVHGNEGYCDQEININDDVKPTISGSYPTTADVTVNNCQFSVPNISENYRDYASDNCSGKMFMTMGQKPAAGTVIPVTADEQTITVKVFATDLCGNTSDSLDVTVTVPAQLTLTISDYNSQCYGEDDGYIEYSVAGGKTQYQVDLLGTTTGFQLVADNNTHRFNNLKDGNYTIKVTDANGCITSNPTAISISQISDNLVVTALSKTWVYDGQAHDTLFYNIDFGSEHYTNIASGASQTLSNGDKVRATISGTITNVDQSPVVNDVVSVTVTRNDETITCFYNQDLVDGELNITKAGSDKVTMNCPTVPTDRTWVYDAQPHSVAVTATSTIVGTDVFTITYSEDGTNYNLTECPTITNVGTKHVWVKAHNDNYDDATCDFVMEITKAGPDKQNLQCPNVADSSWVYDGNDHFAYATANPIGGETPTIEYSLDSVNWSTDAKSITYVTESPKHVFVRSTHPNYEDAACGFDLVISPADDIHVQMNCPTAEGSTWMFDGTAHFVTVSATSDIVGTDEFEITYSTDGGTTWSATRPERIDAGETNVTVKAHNPNYEDATCTYKLTVTQKPVTIEVTATLPYNGWQQVVKYDGTVGYYDGQQVSYDSQIVNPDPQGNNQSVNAPVVTVTVTGLIDNDYLTGGEMVTSDYHVGQYTYNYAPTMALGLMAPVTGTLSMVTPFTSEKGIGNYAVTYKLKADIVKRVLDLTADDASKTYDGTALTSNGYTVTGGSVATTDNVASIMHTGEQLCVGTSAHGINGAMIQRNTEDVTDQYTITYNAGTLTVNNYTGLECPVAETVTLNYGECDITYVITGTPALADPTAIAAGKYSFINNIAFLNPLPAGDNDITWYLLDACGDTMTTCTQTVTVNYPTCPDAVDNENNTYHSVRIGCDCWTVRNLESTKYSDGSAIPDVMTYYAPMYYSDQAYNLATYGHLYTWQAAIKDGSVNAYGHVPGICPAGWYLPTKEQYEGLNAYGPDALRATSSLWIDGGGTNTTGFTGLPGGKYAGALDRYEDMTIKDYYWSTSNATGSITPAEVELTMNCLIVKDVPTSNSNGYSIRCIKEKE